MEIKQMLVNQSKYSIKCPHKMNAKFIVHHNTFNDAPAVNEVKYMISNNNQVSFHFAVDDKEVVQGVLLDRNAWHASDGVKADGGNMNGIAVETCYSKSGGSKFDLAEKNSAKFIAQLLKERNWGIDRVRKHQDFSGKYCPHRTLDLGWQRFLNMIQAELNIINAAPAANTVAPQQPVQQPGVKWLNLKPNASTWRVWSLDGKKHVGTLLPSKYSGLSYRIVRYIDATHVVINTKSFGQVRIAIGYDQCTISDSRVFGNGED